MFYLNNLYMFENINFQNLSRSRLATVTHIGKIGIGESVPFHMIEDIWILTDTSLVFKLGFSSHTHKINRNESNLVFDSPKHIESWEMNRDF